MKFTVLTIALIPVGIASMVLAVVFVYQLTDFQAELMVIGGVSSIVLGAALAIVYNRRDINWKEKLALTTLAMGLIVGGFLIGIRPTDTERMNKLWGDIGFMLTLFSLVVILMPRIWHKSTWKTESKQTPVEKNEPHPYH